MEIERKYLLKQLPSNLDSYASKKIAQGYLCTSPVVRVRRSNDSYYMTYKGAGLMVREEYNLPLTKEAYDHLVQKIDGRLIEKTRYLIPLDGGLTAELDVFEGDLAPLTLVEVEFDGVGGVGDDLTEEDLLVGIDGVDHQIQQTLGFGFELFFTHVDSSFLWNSQCNKFIQKPRKVNSTLVFRYNHYFVTFFGIFFTELYHQAIMRVDWNFHIVQTSVTRNHNNTFNLKVHFKSH